MQTNEVYQVTQGAALVINVTLMDANGNALAFDGTQTLATTVWPGGSRAASFTATTAWVTPSAGTIAITITAAETTGLTPGRYQLLTRLTDSGTPVDAYGCNIDVSASAGTGTAPPTYPFDPAVAYQWLKRYGRSWLSQLQTSEDEASFIEQMGRARSALDDVILAKYRVASMMMVIGSQAFGPRISGARSQWLTDQLAANSLIVTDRVCEICAKRALAFICEGQIGVGDSAKEYARLARMYHSQADYLTTCHTAELGPTSAGIASIVIDLSIVNPLYG